MFSVLPSLASGGKWDRKGGSNGKLSYFGVDPATSITLPLGRMINLGLLATGVAIKGAPVEPSSL